MFLTLVGGIVLVLAVPVAVVGSILTRQHAPGHVNGDLADKLLAAAAPPAREASVDGQTDWEAALSAELATVTGPRERRRFAGGDALALLGTSQARRSFLIAAAVAVAFGAGLLGIARAGLGDDGLGSVTVLIPPVLLFSIACLCARSARSMRFGLETGVLAALTILIAVAFVYAVEAAHWYHAAPGISVLDGEHVEYDSTRAAVLNAVHLIILLVHLVFWLPWAVVGAVVGARGPRAAAGRPVDS